MPAPNATFLESDKVHNDEHIIVILHIPVISMVYMKFSNHLCIALNRVPDTKNALNQYNGSIFKAKS